MKNAKITAPTESKQQLAHISYQIEQIRKKVNELSSEQKKTTESIVDSFRTLIEMVGDVGSKLESKAATIQNTNLSSFAKV